MGDSQWLRLDETMRILDGCYQCVTILVAPVTPRHSA
jgi:hypothetical protein